MNGAIEHDKQYVRLKDNKIICFSQTQQYYCCFYKKNGIYGVNNTKNHYNQKIFLRMVKLLSDCGAKKKGMRLMQ
jgi:hypothetical protein